jgi:alkylglycerol monooxygenase
MLKPTTLAIPLFFLLIGVELLITHYQKRKLYRLNDSITNLNIGGTQQIVGVLMSLVGIGLYDVIYHKFSFQLIDISAFSWTNFIILFIAWDFCYYWAHRISHEVNLMWSAHVVHHQSEEYNLTVALRQSWFQGVWTAPFYLPLALIGFSPMDVVLVSGINLIYQFWIHTEVVNKMGFLEYVMNTPSHHRVHHGRNPKYIDKNHAGVFIIWDKLFGTFQKEEEKPTYGITTPVNSWNPIWVNFAHFKNIGAQLKEADSLKDKMKVLFYKPGWSAKMAAYIPVPDVARDSLQKFDTLVPISVNWYVIFQYVLTATGIVFFLFNIQQLTLPAKLLASTLVLAGVWTTGGLLEKKKEYYRLEYFRLFLSWLVICYLLFNTSYLYAIIFGGIGIMIISYTWLWHFRYSYLLNNIENRLLSTIQ